MSKEYGTFLKHLLLFSLPVFVLVLVWNYYTGHKIYSWPVLIYFVATTALIHLLLINASKTSSQHFIRAFMGATALKLFLNLIIITIFALLKKNEAMGFAIYFLLLYFAYSAFEVAKLLKLFKG